MRTTAVPCGRHIALTRFCFFCLKAPLSGGAVGVSIMSENLPTTREALTIADFCAAYSVGRSRTYEMIGARELVARKCGKRTLIARADAERWLQKLPVLVT